MLEIRSVPCYDQTEEYIRCNRVTVPGMSVATLFEETLGANEMLWVTDIRTHGSMAVCMLVIQRDTGTGYEDVEVLASPGKLHTVGGSVETSICFKGGDKIKVLGRNLQQQPQEISYTVRGVRR